MKKICKVCGKEFEGYRTSKYCCIKCRNFHLSYHEPYPESGTRICKNCGKKYYYTKGQDNYKNITSKSNKNSGKSPIHFCSYECGCEYTQKQLEKTIHQRYSVNNISKLDTIKLKKQKTCEKHYGVKNPMQLQEVKQKVIAQKDYEAIGNKIKLRWKELSEYKKTEVMEKRKNTCLQKYGVSTPLALETEDWKEKRYNTKKKNHTFNTSRAEKEIERILKTKFKVINCQYKSSEYPFTCDFYIPERNLYIEYQGHWSHGEHAFDKNNRADIEIVNKWKNKNTKYYEQAINTWTLRDPIKRETVKKNNVNWIEFFSLAEFTQWFYQTFTQS